VLCARIALESDVDPARLDDTPTERRSAFASWASKARRAVETVDAREPGGPRKRLVFVVSIDSISMRGDGRPRVVLTPHAVTLRKDGAPGKAAPFDLSSNILRYGGMRPAWLDDDDVALWYRLRTMVDRENRSWGYPAARLPLPHFPDAARLFADFVATGRCRFGAAEGPVLVPAPPRVGKVAWEIEPTGVQHLRVRPRDEGPPWVVLPLLPLHWVDPHSGACGTIELDVPQAIAPWLVDVPPVDPDWSGGLPSELRTALAACGLPPPRTFEQTSARRVDPTPVLRLRTRRHDADLLPFAELAFDYDGVVVDAGQPSSRLFRIDGDKLHRVHRNRAVEHGARGRIAALGLGGPGTALAMRSTDAWIELARTGIATLKAEGWRVEIDPDFEWLAVPVDRFVASTRGGEEEDTWFVELGIEVEGVRIDLLPLVLAAIQSGRILRERLRSDRAPVLLPLPDGRRVAIDGSRLADMLDVLVELYDAKDSGPLKIGKTDAARLDALEGWALELEPKLAAFVERMRAGSIARVELPVGLEATLRDYQCRGLDWLQWLREAELGGILADDMGLGKTVQALAHVLVEKHAGRLDRPALVVAPRSVLRNWEREAERFTPGLRCAVYHGPARASVLESLTDFDVVITTYALLQRDEALAAVSWRIAILDEAQMIKNPGAKVAAAARSLVADQRICMTGTPMENNLGDLWSLMTFANPGLLGNPKQFGAWYRNPIEKSGDSDRFDALCRRIAPFLLRRTKAQVLSELPPKTEILLHAALEGPQRDLYESVRLTMEKRVRDELAARGLARSQIVVLDALLKLRQVCCDPRLLKLDAAARATNSAKLALLVELLQELHAEGRRALVFSQFTSMLAVIELELVKLGIPWLSITGKTEARQEIVDRFQAGEVPVLLVSLKAGGTGLNLTAADTVIHYDPWWNPAVEAQATDRAHRIGQSQPVTVYRLICEGTVEERMLALQARKAALLRGIQSSAERRASAGFTLDASDIAELLAPLRA
jgi:superfamily II DNA or RNA helicase